MSSAGQGQGVMGLDGHGGDQAGDGGLVRYTPTTSVRLLISR